MTKKKVPETIEECAAEIELTQKKIRQLENRNKMLDQKLAAEKRKATFLFDTQKKTVTITELLLYRPVNNPFFEYAKKAAMVMLYFTDQRTVCKQLQLQDQKTNVISGKGSIWERHTIKRLRLFVRTRNLLSALTVMQRL